MSDAALPPPPPRDGAPLLPPDAGRDRPLFVVAAILVFLACLAGLGASGAWRTAESWANGIESEATIWVSPEDGRDAQADAAAAAEIAAAIQGVRSAESAGREGAEALVAPWLGEGGLPEDLPISFVVELRLDPRSGDVAERLQAALDEAGLPGRVDDHSRYAQATTRVEGIARTLGLSLLVLTAGAAAAVVAFAARASLAARIDVITALHLSGAEDSYIAALFQRRFFMLGLKAGAAGAFAAAAVYLQVFYGGAPDDETRYFLSDWVIAPLELAMLGLAPFLAGGTAALSARLAVAADLRERW
jgi:cell division transport system permease protein